MAQGVSWNCCCVFFDKKVPRWLSDTPTLSAQPKNIHVLIISAQTLDLEKEASLNVATGTPSLLTHTFPGGTNSYYCGFRRLCRKKKKGESCIYLVWLPYCGRFDDTMLFNKGHHLQKNMHQVLSQIMQSTNWVLLLLFGQLKRIHGKKKSKRVYLLIFTPVFRDQGNNLRGDVGTKT